MEYKHYINWEKTESVSSQYGLPSTIEMQVPYHKNLTLKHCATSRVVTSWIYPPSNSLSFCFLTSSSSRFRLASKSFRCLSSSSFRCFQTVYSLCFASEICCNLAFWPVNCWALVVRSCMKKVFRLKINKLFVNCKISSWKVQSSCREEMIFLLNKYCNVLLSLAQWARAKPYHVVKWDLPRTSKVQELLVWSVSWYSSFF